MPSTMAPFCLTNLAATGVARRDEGLKYGITDPVLWVYDQAGDFNTLVKTREARDTLMPVWSETICLDFAPGPGVGDRPCFEIRDDFDPNFPPEFPPMLHYGCASEISMSSWGDVSIVLQDGVDAPTDHLSGTTRLAFTIIPRTPAPPPSPPAIPAPRPPPPSEDVAERLNTRFRTGRTEDTDLARAGVVVHQFDSLDDPNPNHSPWLPGASHHETGDRISGALINAAMQADPGHNIPIYSYSLAGIILAPKTNKLLCSYPYDVGSLSRRCFPSGVSGSCIPGCGNNPNLPMMWCDPNTDFWKRSSPACAWKPEHLDTMMRARNEIRREKLKPPQKKWNDNKYYNELIFDASYYVEHLPDSIEAVFYLDDNCGDAYDGPKCKDYGWGAHHAIASHFGLDSKRLPLLKLDLWNWEAPFSKITAPYEAPSPAPPPFTTPRASDYSYSD